MYSHDIEDFWEVVASASIRSLLSHSRSLLSYSRSLLSYSRSLLSYYRGLREVVASATIRLGLFCHIVGLFCHIVGLFCHIVGLFCQTIEDFWEVAASSEPPSAKNCSSSIVMLAMPVTQYKKYIYISNYIVGLFCHIVGLFCHTIVMLAMPVTKYKKYIYIYRIKRWLSHNYIWYVYISDMYIYQTKW